MRFAPSCGLSTCGVGVKSPSRTLPYYLALCDSCEWYDDAGHRPVRARRKAILHAKRNDDHGTSVINLQRLVVVTRHRFTPIDDVNGPPF